MYKIILLSGKAEHGKTYTANVLKDYIEEEQGKKVVITHYAKFIKQMMTDYYNWNGVKTPEYRKLLQWLGTERIKGELQLHNYHAKRLAEEITIFKDEFDYFIVDDLRFPEEAEHFKEVFPDMVTTVRINRTVDVGERYINSLSEEAKQHSSETAMDDYNFDIVIDNSELFGIVEYMEYLKRAGVLNER